MINEEWETNQTVVAAFLVYCGFKIVEYRWESNACSFVFRDSGKLHREVERFISREALVEPQAFNNSFAQVRNHMFAKRDEAQGR